MKKNFLAHFGPKGSKNFFLTDFNENWRAYSQNYGSSENQKNFWNFSFFGPIFVRKHFSHASKWKIFYSKFFILSKIWIDESLIHFGSCDKKLVFSTKIENRGVWFLSPGGRDPQICYPLKLPCPLVVD